jgi:hypothetical protein
VTYDASCGYIGSVPLNMKLRARRGVEIERARALL